MSCAVIGDSIAASLAHVMVECASHARSGITSQGYVGSMLTPIGADLVVISLGANDWHLDTRPALRAVRLTVTAERVVWLLPNIHRAGVRDAIIDVAAERGDALLDTAPFAGPDGVHPTLAGYRAIRAAIAPGTRVAEHRP